MNLHVGTSGYAYKEWKGPFYPADLPAKSMLHYYAERFSCVEINNTFYRMPTPAVLASWSKDVPRSFRFVLKAPQRITHMKRLKDVADPLSHLLEVAATLKSHLGPLLFQLPPNMKKDAQRLSEFLAMFPPRTRVSVAFEFRHESWFDGEVYALLGEHEAAICIADAEGELQVPFASTADWGYLRLRRGDYSTADLKKWIKRIEQQAWRDAYIFFKHEDEATGPKLATRLLELATR